MNTNHSSSFVPETVHTPRQLSTNLRIPGQSPPEVDNPCLGVPPLRRLGRLRMGMIGLAVAVGALALLLAAWNHWGDTAGGLAGGGLGQLLGGGLLQGGLPPTGDSEAGMGTTADGGEEPTAAVTELSSEPGETGLTTGGIPGSDPSDETFPEETSPEDPPEETPGREETEMPEELTAGEDGTDTRPPEPPDTGTNMEGTGTNPADEITESEIGDKTEPETGETPPKPGVPAGCYPIASEDMSRAEYGVGYVTGEGVELPPQLPEGRLWGVEGIPTVLVINTHPYEGYSDGGDWYDPTTGSLAQVSSPTASGGTVALAAELTRNLRERGITVIHLRIAVSSEDSAADIYERTETVARYYCRLYPDIGLILNLRRSAELTEEGEVLRTEGEWNGDACAQVRISVSGGRSGESFGRDLAVALALRAVLWEEEPTLSRPVWAKTGKGFAGDLDRVRILTLEMGSAGNTYPQAERLAAPLTQAVSKILKSK